MYNKVYNYIVSFLSKKQPYSFNEEFRKGYKNAWIDNIKDYTP
jgi:hypothetical protein